MNELFSIAAKFTFTLLGFNSFSTPLNRHIFNNICFSFDSHSAHRAQNGGKEN